MLKKIIVAAILLIVGYTLAVWFPMPGNIESQLHSIAGTVNSKVDEAVAVVEGDKDESKAMPEEAQDNGDYFKQADLLFRTQDLGAKSTILLGSYPDESLADAAVSDLQLKDEINKFPFQLPTGTRVTLVTIGSYDTQQEALKRKMELESTYDLNLQLVKFPTKEAPPPDQKEQLVEALIDVLNSKSKEPEEKEPEEKEPEEKEPDEKE